MPSNTCIDCGKPIRSSSKRCQVCAGAHNLAEHKRRTAPTVSLRGASIRGLSDTAAREVHTEIYNRLRNAASSINPDFVDGLSDDEREAFMAWKRASANKSTCVL